jgi:hypothetical protein
MWGDGNLHEGGAATGTRTRESEEHANLALRKLETLNIICSISSYRCASAVQAASLLSVISVLQQQNHFHSFHY